MESDKEVVVPEKEQTAGEIEAAFGDAFTEAADTAEKKPVPDVAEEVVEKDEPLEVTEVVKVEEPVKAAVVEEDPLQAKPVVKAVTAVEEPVKVSPPAPLDLKADGGSALGRVGVTLVARKLVSLKHCKDREAVPYEAAFLAAKVFQRYRKKGGKRTSNLPDF